MLNSTPRLSQCIVAKYQDTLIELCSHTAKTASKNQKFPGARPSNSMQDSFSILSQLPIPAKVGFLTHRPTPLTPIVQIIRTGHCEARNFHRIQIFVDFMCALSTYIIICIQIVRELVSKPRTFVSQK